MLRQPYFLFTGLILILGWSAVALGFNMSFTWWVHQLGNNSFDDFFIHFSALAEWALILAAASIALIRDWKRGLWMGLALGIQALLVVGIKSALNAPRPIEINAQLVRLIPHLEIHHWQAFPSGHTAVGFFTMGWLALNYPDKYNHKRMVAAILAILAIGIGYSRMYLAQHSLIDVCAGGSLALILLTLSDHFGRKLNIHE